MMENVRRQLGASRYFLSFHSISHPFSTKNAEHIAIETTQKIIHKYLIPESKCILKKNKIFYFPLIMGALHQGRIIVVESQP